MGADRIFKGWLLVGALLLPANTRAVAEPTPTAPSALKPSETIGMDVMNAAHRWLSGDVDGRRQLEDFARAGRSDAEEILGEVWFRGAPGGQDTRAVACRYFVLASRTRRDALHSAAHCSEIGVDGPPDFAGAALLYQEAADRGYAKSMCALGNLYITGRGVAKDPERGARLCQRGAEAGDKDAQTDFGNLYLHGLGVPHDMVQARHWYELAAAQGQANAEFVLGKIYWNGDGVARDQAKAALLWRAAYHAGRTDAAPLLASWAMSRWMAAQPNGDIAILDEAVAWEQLALMTAPNEQARGQATALLELMRATREAKSQKTKADPSLSRQVPLEK